MKTFPLFAGALAVALWSVGPAVPAGEAPSPTAVSAARPASPTTP